MSDVYETKKPYRARRTPDRARYDKKTVHALLDQGLVAHVGYIGGTGAAHVIPIFYARRGDELVFHVSSKSGLGLAAKEGAPMCATVTLIDSIVYARSGFHHSMKFRSVAAHGPTELVTGDDKLTALDFMIDRLEPGRAAHLRPINAQEIKATHVVRLRLDQVTAKMSVGEGPNEEPEDLDWPVWAGIVPVNTVFGVPRRHDPSVSDAGRPSLTGPLFRK
jgi:hypothetical protein|tara:strand:- start:201 stop:860 length:660 start_codon:yes stop_codon:yes gene_type:complete